MYNNVNVHTTIGDLKLDFLHSAEVVSTFKKLTDTAVIELPRKIKVNEQGIKDVIKAGQPVSIYSGYDDNLQLEFSGYVARVSPEVPLKIYCEDAAWLLKRTTITQTFNQVTLKEMIQYFFDQLSEGDLSFDVADTGVIGTFIFEEVSIAKCLEIIRKSTGLAFWFEGTILKSNFAYQVDDFTADPVVFNINEYNLPSSLEYRRKDDVKFKVITKSINSEGKELKYETGEDGGDTLSFQVGYNKPLEWLEKEAKAIYSNAKVDGYKGNFTAFGVPYVAHRDVIRLQDEDLPEQNGNYLVNKTVTRVGMGGYKRIIYPGKKVA